MQNKFPWKTLLWVSVFAVAFAMVETAVVIYLRTLYYPDGFAFPLNMISPGLVGVEIAREAATMFLLLSIAIVAGRKLKASFAWFIYAFAVWDIFYYVFLKVVLGWPDSLLTWDVLFLIPVTWSGPVITPIIISLIMVLFALVIRFFNNKSGLRFYMEPREWIILLSGALVVFVSFIWDYTSYLFDHLNRQMLGNRKVLQERMEELAYSYVPVHFNWLIFIMGVVLLLIALTMVYRRNRKKWKPKGV